MMKHLARMIVLAAFLIGGAHIANAQEYPNRPIRVVVPFPVGGAPDVLARTISAKLSERLGQPVVIENRLGAGGNIAYGHVASSAPDGYTLLLAGNGLATNVSLYKDLPYDATKDFAPITIVVPSSPHVLVVNPKIQAHSVEQLIALAKENPGRLTFASSGSGTIPHLAGELFKTMARVNLLHVPYRGMPLAHTDLLGGQVALMFSDVPGALPLINAGKLRALAVTSAHRVPAIPDLPTIAEAGIPGYAIVAWFGLLAPAGTPGSVVTKLNREILAVLGDAELKRKMAEIGQDVAGSTPEEFAAFIRSEVTNMGALVKASGATIR